MSSKRTGASSRGCPGESRNVIVNGVKLHATIDGPVQPTGTLVLLHGFTGSAASWRKHSMELASHGLRVIAFDMLGHGRSDAPADAGRYTMEHCRADIIDALRALGVRENEAILLGYSMGGRIALYSAFSGFFRALILESASPGLATDAERVQRRQQDEALAERIEREGVEPFVAYWEQLPLFASQQALPAATRASLHSQRLHNQTVGLANSLRGVGTGMQPALDTRLPELDLPALLIAGDMDAKFCAIARRMAWLLPRAQVEIVAGAGHAIHLEQPGAFDRLVLDFCRIYAQHALSN
jgi:2-succinyl-6-hydroxy-2,4-cyclohexadiene-1-carboxylate synthase